MARSIVSCGSGTRSINGTVNTASPRGGVRHVQQNAAQDVGEDVDDLLDRAVRMGQKTLGVAQPVAQLHPLLDGEVFRLPAGCREGE